MPSDDGRGFPRSERRFFFCQLEAVESLIWLTEAPAAEKVGIEVPSDGGEFERLCSKMATGSGKTIVTAMVIAWHILNKVTYPQNARFSKNVLVIAPGLAGRCRVLFLQGPGYQDGLDRAGGIEHRATQVVRAEI